MRIFKIITIMILSIPLFGQSRYILVDNSDTLKIDKIENIYNSLEHKLSSTDEIGNKLNLTNILSDSVYNYSIYKKQLVVDTLISNNKFPAAA